MEEIKHTAGPLEIWGQQVQTEISGFYMIGPKESNQKGCTAYVANHHDALLYASAPDISKQLHEVNGTLEAIREQRDMFRDKSIDLEKLQEEAENRAKHWYDMYMMSLRKIDIMETNEQILEDNRQILVQKVCDLDLENIRLTDMYEGKFNQLDEEYQDLVRIATCLLQSG
jgi:hypothetical protein